MYTHTSLRMATMLYLIVLITDHRLSVCFTVVEDATSKPMMIALAVLAAVFFGGGVVASGLWWKNVRMKNGLSRSAEAKPVEYIKIHNSFGSDSAMPITSEAIQQNINGLHPEFRKEHHRYFLEHPKQNVENSTV